MRHPIVYKKRRKKKANKIDYVPISLRFTDGRTIRISCRDSIPDMSMRDMVEYCHAKYDAVLLKFELVPKEYPVPKFRKIRE